jgi:hypothetical protein
VLTLTSGKREPLDQQLHGGLDEVARQISRLCDEASDLRTANDQYYLRRGTIGITDPKSAKYSREPRPHFLLVAPGDDPARMFVIGKLRRKVEEGTAAIGGVPDPLRDPR